MSRAPPSIQVVNSHHRGAKEQQLVCPDVTSIEPGYIPLLGVAKVVEKEQCLIKGIAFKGRFSSASFLGFRQMDDGLALGWCPAVGLRLREQFSSFWGLPVVRALFDRFGLEQPQGGIDADPAWFFDESSTSTCSISDVKWRIWSVAAMGALQFPIPHEALHLLIAANYLTRQGEGDQPDADHEQQPLPPYASLSHLRCFAVMAKLDKVMDSSRPTGEEELITSYYEAVRKMPPCKHSLSDCLYTTFDMSELLGRLVALWLRYQIGCNKQSLEWLAALEAQAVARQGGQLGLLLSLFLGHHYARGPQEPLELDDVKALFRLVPKMEHKGIDLSGVAQQLLEEVVDCARHGGRVSSGDVDTVNNWIREKSALGAQRRARHSCGCRDESVRIGKLLHLWSRTEKGQAGLQKLKAMCNVTAAHGFAEHVQCTLAGSHAYDRDCEVLFRAAEVVFGNRFCDAFVTLCAHATLWKGDPDVCLDVGEIVEVLDMARWGCFQVNPPFEDEHACLNKMILYLAYSVLEDHLDLQHANKREIWMDCEQIPNYCAGHPPVNAPRSRTGVFWLNPQQQPRPRTCI